MLINTSIAVAIRCDTCGRLKVHTISLFDFVSNQKMKLACECHHTNAIINTQDRKTFWIEIPCFACQDTHVFTYSMKQFFKSNIISRCIETGMEIGYIGKHKDVQKLLSEQERNSYKTIDELGFYDYFDNSDVVMQSISKIRELELNDKVFCDCGYGDIEINLFPDRIELNCLNCNSIQMIYAENEEDLKNLANKESIILNQHSFGCIDAINQNKKNSKK